MCLTRMEESRRMELHELHVGNCSLCTIHHCLTITSSDDRVGRGLIYCSTAASTHKSHLTEICIYFLCLRIENVCTIALYVLIAACHGNTKVMLSDNLHGEVMLLYLNIGIGAHSSDKSALNLCTCVISMMEDAEFRVTALTMKVESAIFLLVEIDTPLHQFLNLRWSHTHYLFNGSAVGNEVAGNHGVFDMFFEVINHKVSN